MGSCSQINKKVSSDNCSDYQVYYFRTILSLVALFGWKLHQTDVKTVFLNGKIKVEAYVEQPKSFVKKALYAPRVWYARMDGLLHDLGFSKSAAKSNLYFEVVHNHVLILVLCADELFLTQVLNN